MKIVVAAEEAAGMQLLRALVAKGHPIAGVLATPDAGPDGAPSVWNVAAKLGLRTWPAALVRTPAFAATLAAEGVDLLLNVHSLHIIHPEVLRAVRLGAFNMHPGPLPRYAGLNAPSWALYRGERTHGVTLHRIDPGIDTGPIAGQAVFAIEPSDTALTLYTKCVRSGLPLMLRLVESLAANPAGLHLQEQDLSQREYFGRQVPQQGRIYWSKPAREIVGFVRACDFFPFPSPWGHPRARLGDREIGLAKASPTGEAAAAAAGTVQAQQDGKVRIACRDESILVSHVIADGVCRPAADVLEPGQRLDDGD